MIHELKCQTKYFNELVEGNKTFEVRKNDRNFKIGDFLAINEYQNEEYTGNCMLFGIHYILDDMEYVKEGYVILGIKPYSIQEKDKPESWTNV